MFPRSEVVADILDIYMSILNINIDIHNLIFKCNSNGVLLL